MPQDYRNQRQFRQLIEALASGNFSPPERVGGEGTGAGGFRPWDFTLRDPSYNPTFADWSMANPNAGSKEQYIDFDQPGMSQFRFQGASPEEQYIQATRNSPTYGGTFFDDYIVAGMMGLGGAGIAGFGGAGATATESAAAPTAGGAVNPGFFPDILNTGFIDPSLGSSILDTQFSALPMLDTPTGFLTPGVTEAGLAGGIPGFESGAFFGDQAGAGSFFSPPSGDNLAALQKLLMGTNQQGETKGIADLFGNRGVLGTGLAVAPALAAINYARNQGPFDTSRLKSAYNQIDPNSLALPFDLQTATGRNNLTSSLTQRNVMGSSFGNQDLASYDMLRHAGRQNILTSGAQAQAGIGGQILDAEVKERALKNDLYGRALLALSAGLNPPQTNINVGLPGAPNAGGGNPDILKLLGLGGGLSGLFA